MPNSPERPSSHPARRARISTRARAGGLALLCSALLLSGCVTLYSREAQWRLPPRLGDHLLTAKLEAGLITWTATVAIDERPILTGDSYFWSDTVHLTGSFTGLPLAADCDKVQRICDVSLAGLRPVHLVL